MSVLPCTLDGEEKRSRREDERAAVVRQMADLAVDAALNKTGACNFRNGLDAVHWLKLSSRTGKKADNYPFRILSSSAFFSC